MPRKRSTLYSTTIKQPVGFYKFVALTFLFVTVALFGVILFISSKRAKITIVTTTEPVETSFTVDIGDATDDTHVKGLVVATDVAVEKDFSVSGSRKEPSAASGIVTIYNDSSREQPLIATTRLLTPDGVLFRLKNGAVARANGTVDAEVYADQKGISGNMGATTFTIPGLNEARQKEVYAKSTAAMTGGEREVGSITQEDLDNAKKVLLEEASTQGGVKLSGEYPDLKGAFIASDAGVTFDRKAGDQAGSFTSKGKAKVVGVFFNNADLIGYAKTMLEKQAVSENELLISTVDPVVTPASVNAESGTATLTVSQSGKVTLNANGKALEKVQFFGKTEDEIRRYVMSLEHVQGVEMRFRPIWNKSAPRIADHIDIVVREVE